MDLKIIMRKVVLITALKRKRMSRESDLLMRKNLIFKIVKRMI